MSCELIEQIGTGDCELDKNCKSNPNIASVIASEIVVEILENVFEIAEENNKQESAKVAGDIIDNLSSNFKEMKLAEIGCNPENSRPLKGLGDQLTPNECVKETVRHPPVEKKNRLTDLVKNSKNILSKLILNESKSGEETTDEKVIRVVELDSGDQPFRAKKVRPENIPLPRSESISALNSSEDEANMDEIDLKNTTDKTTETIETNKKTMTFPFASTSSGKTSSLMARYRTLKFPSELKNSKWNIGSKLMNYIKKKQGKRDEKEKKLIEPLSSRMDRGLGVNRFFLPTRTANKSSNWVQESGYFPVNYHEYNIRPKNPTCPAITPV